MERNKILPIISILFIIIFIAVLAAWLISSQQKPEPEDIIEETEEEDIIEDKEEEEFVSVEPIGEQAETDEEVKAPFPAEEIEDDAAFQETILQLNTPQKLIDYLNKNFSFKEEESDYSLSPEEFFEAKSGKRNDIATFSSFVLFQHGYFPAILRYKFIDQENKERIRTVTIFREEDAAKYIDLENSNLVIHLGGHSPIELLEFEEKRYNIKITEYAAFIYGRTDLSKPAWLPK